MRDPSPEHFWVFTTLSTLLIPLQWVSATDFPQDLVSCPAPFYGALPPILYSWRNGRWWKKKVNTKSYADAKADCENDSLGATLAVVDNSEDLLAAKHYLGTTMDEPIGIRHKGYPLLWIA